MERLYSIGEKTYCLAHKDYDDSLFGTEVFELFEINVQNDKSLLSKKGLKKDLSGISFCTFRGSYNIEAIIF